MPITIVVIDDHALFRRGVMQILSSDLELNVIGEHSSGPDGLSLIKNLKPDVVMIEINIKGKSGLETLINIKKDGNESRCIVLTSSESSVDLLEALRAGADGYLLKEIGPAELCKNIKKVMSGVVVVDDNLNNVLKNALIYPAISINEDASLTEREKEVLECLSSGLNNKKIARVLGICETTVKAHIKNLLTKLKLTSRLQAAVWAHKNKLST